jgi:hypothetical protein
MKKLDVLKKIQSTSAVPYSFKAKIITPILNKLIDEPTDEESLVKAYREEERQAQLEYEEL